MATSSDNSNMMIRSNTNNNNFRESKEIAFPKNDECIKQQLIHPFWRDLHENSSIGDNEPDMYLELPEWKSQNDYYQQQLDGPFAKDASAKSIYTRATSLDSDSCFNNPPSSSFLSTQTDPIDTMKVPIETTQESLHSKENLLQFNRSNQIIDQYPQPIHSNESAIFSSSYPSKNNNNNNNIQGHYFEEKPSNPYNYSSNPIYHPPSCPQIDSYEKEQQIQIQQHQQKINFGFGSEGNLCFGRSEETWNKEIKYRQFETKQSEISNMNAFFEKDMNPQSSYMFQTQNPPVWNERHRNDAQVRISQEVAPCHYNNQNALRISRDFNGFVNHHSSNRSEYILQKDQFNPSSSESLQQLPSVIPSFPVAATATAATQVDTTNQFPHMYKYNLEFPQQQQQQQQHFFRQQLSLPDVSSLTINNNSYSGQEYFEQKREYYHHPQQVESQRSTTNTTVQLLIPTGNQEFASHDAALNHASKEFCNIKIPNTDNQGDSFKEITPSPSSKGFEKPRIEKTRQKAMSFPSASNSSSVKRLIRKFSHEQQQIQSTYQYQEINHNMSSALLIDTNPNPNCQLKLPSNNAGNSLDECNEDGSIQTIEEDLEDSEELTIEDLTSNKKNVVKNIMNAFKMYILSWGSKQEITTIYQESAKGSFEEIEDIQRKFKRYIGLKSFNHYSLRLLILHQHYGPLFKHFLSTHSIEWLEKSKIKDVECHQKMIYFFLTCFEDIKTIDILRRHPKKKARFS